MWRWFKTWFSCRFRNIHTFDLHQGERRECPDPECALRQGVFTKAICCEQWMFIHYPWEKLEAHRDVCVNCRKG